MAKDPDFPVAHPSLTVIQGGKGSDSDRLGEPTLRVLTCRVCEARDGIDSWGAIVLVKPSTYGEKIDASHQLLLCATCFQNGIRTYLGTTGAMKL